MTEHYKVGIIGPRTYALDGHDIDNKMRTLLRAKLSKILSDEKRKHQDLIGVTGLGIGTEQDFAISCNNLGISYIAIIAFDDMESIWNDVTQNQQLFNELKEKAEYSVSLNDEGYAPKKIKHKNKQIIEMSNLLIFVRSKLYPVDKQLLDSITIPVVFIDV